MNKLLYSFIVILFFVSCNKEISINNFQRNGTLVLNSLLEVGKEIDIHVTTSRNVSGEWITAMDTLTNADVTVYENGLLLGSLEHVNLGWYELSNSIVKAGAEYEFIVKHRDKKASAKTTVPEIEPYISVDTFSVVKGDYREYNIIVTINDNVGQHNYYEVLRKEASQTTYYNDETNKDTTVNRLYESYLNTSDPVNTANHMLSSILVSDRNFNGESCSVSAFFNELLTEEEYDFIRTSTSLIDCKEISEEYYLYLVSYGRYFDLKENPIAEPVQVYSNVTNGLGIVGSANGQTKCFEIITSE